MFWLTVLPVFGANWTEYKSGPFHVISDAGDKPARDRLMELEQLRHVLATELGKNDLQLVWPIKLVLFANQREYSGYALRQPFVVGGAETLAAWTADKPLPQDWLRALTRKFLEDNAGRMPDATENALCDLFSTIQVNATRVSIGAPPAERSRAWIKLQMLATQPDYAGRLHIYLNNLQQGADEAIAIKNSFDLSKAELESRVDAYAKGGTFAAAPASGLTINPNHDFIEAQVPESAVNELFAGLKAQGKEFPPDSPRGLLAKGTRPALELAAKANPRWAEPHLKLAGLETEPAAKVNELKTAATLEPRNSELWQELAKSQTAADQYADAEKSWMVAERAAANDTERERIHKTRIDFEEERAAFEIGEKKRLAEERAAELQRIKDSAAAEVHSAELAANQRMGGLKPGETAQAWWNDPDGQKVSGTLTRVDCMTEAMRLTVQPASGTAVRLMIRDPNKLTVKGKGQAEFVCGVQKPGRKINVVHNGKADAKLTTAGDVQVVEFP
ncbi:MAG: hypothetical protein JO307_30770 [Bryobacterales bacterium]|nr:hypothetical protein [Bryobacterales bacterium]MBV9398204.1 hypothetical protein [Bryobacterales bacterium]